MSSDHRRWILLSLLRGMLVFRGEFVERSGNS